MTAPSPRSNHVSLPQAQGPLYLPREGRNLRHASLLVNRWRAVRLVIGIAASAGCNTTSAPPASVVRDSAGVRIVENVAPKWTPETAWHLSSDPLVDIGGGDDEQQQLFRVTGAVRLSDGRIVVANSGARELRFYDARGTYLSSLGREGGGPGEFRSMSRVRLLAADSLLVYDFVLQRMSVFSTDVNATQFAGGFSLATPDQGFFPFPIGVFSDGEVLIRTSASSAGMPPAGLSREQLLLWRYSPDGQPIDTIGTFQGDESYRTGEGQRTVAMGVPFGRSAIMALSGTHLFYSSSDSYTIDAFSSDGRLERSIRYAIANAPVTREDIERVRRPPEDPSRPRPPPLQRLLDEVPLPETKPAHGEMIVDAAGNLWVAEYSLRRFEATSWTVFDPQGTLLGTVHMPPGSRLRQIGHDYVLGLWRDEDEVEHVRMYGLVKPGR